MDPLYDIGEEKYCSSDNKFKVLFHPLTSSHAIIWVAKEEIWHYQLIKKNFIVQSLVRETHSNAKGKNKREKVFKVRNSIS